LVGIRAIGRGTGSGIEVAQHGFTLYVPRRKGRQSRVLL
jgi:hypothetical protein